MYRHDSWPSHRRYAMRPSHRRNAMRRIAGTQFSRLFCIFRLRACLHARIHAHAAWIHAHAALASTHTQRVVCDGRKCACSCASEFARARERERARAAASRVQGRDAWEQELAATAAHTPAELDAVLNNFLGVHLLEASFLLSVFPAALPPPSPPVPVSLPSLPSPPAPSCPPLLRS